MSKEAERFSLEDITKAFKAGADWQEGGTILYPDLNGYIQLLSTKEEGSIYNFDEKEKIILSNIRNKTGISIEWLQLWGEVENWYGDPKKRETGEQFLKRVQGKYFQLSSYKSSLIERLEEEVKKVAGYILRPTMSDTKRIYWRGKEAGLQEAIELIKQQ